MRVAFYSPLPPERSGIADYSFELLEELRHHVEVVAVVADKQVKTARAPEGVEVLGVSSVESERFDANCYQMGNNSKYHRFFFGRAMEEPGLLLMHDPSLADFTAEMCGGAEGVIFRDEVSYDCPDIGPRDDLPLVDVGNGRRDLDRLRVLLARRILSSNVRTLVHSSAMAREMRLRYPAADVQAIQLPAPVLPEHVCSGERPPGEIVFGVFGGINYYKRVRPVVDAFLDVRSRHPLARMVVAGRADDHLLERELRALAMRPDVDGALEVKTDLSLAELEHEMQRCDVGISLRWPTAGEMSATLMRTFGAGRPAIVSDVLQFRELDERYVWRVTTDFDDEHESLVEVMGRAALDPSMCKTAGAAARAFVEHEATYEVVAGQYVEHLEHCASRRSAKRLAREPFSLPASRSLGVNLIVPQGSGEVAEAGRRVTAALRSQGVDVVVVELEPVDRLPERSTAPARQGTSDDESDRQDTSTGGETSAEIPWGRDDAEKDADELRDAIRSLAPEDLRRQGDGPHPVDWYFVEPGEAERYGRLATVRRGRGRRIVPVVSPECAPLGKPYRKLLELAEHVLAPSVFAAEIAEIATISPVTVVPWPVAARRPPLVVDNGGCCRFLAVVRSDMTVARSNPQAAIAAFRSAFSRAERGSCARLSVVLESARDRPEACSALESELGSIGGELIVDPTDQELDDLVGAADVYVSLHRAEGFGLHLADAMALGKVVLATAWSGNLDYMDRGNVCLVGYTIRFLEQGDLYLDRDADVALDKGSFWAEPDVGRAASWMQRLASEPGLRARLGSAASSAVGEQLDQLHVGAMLRRFLADVTAQSQVTARRARSTVG